MAQTTHPATGTIGEALAHAARLLESAPDLAEKQAREVLEASPADPRAELILGAARRRLGDPAAARAILEPLVRAQPRVARAHLELGLALAEMDKPGPALTALERAVELKRDLPEAWRAIGDLKLLAGDDSGADAAYAELIRASVRDPVLMRAADALVRGRLAEAEHLLRDHLRAHPTDVAAMRMLAETGTRLGRYGDVEALLTECLALSPSFSPARHNLAVVLYRQQKAAAAIPHLERLLSESPNNPVYRNLLAACLGLVGEYGRAIDIFRELLAEHPNQWRVWLSLGHALRTGGRSAEAAEAYRRAAALKPDLGEAWFSLANMKTRPFEPADVAAMEAALAQPGLDEEDALNLHYALGKAREDEGDFAPAFEHYAKGAALRRARYPHDGDETHAFAGRSRALFTAGFFAERAGAGLADPAPIFVVGLPRAGSTLIEQILASHSLIEGTMELPDIGHLTRDLGAEGRKGRGAPYPEILAELSADELRSLGEAFIERTRIHRKAGLPFFIDKMPNNFQHIGLIVLILPQAKIIDARRAPMASCFSAFKQHFARGHSFSYDLTDVGRYYGDYVELMAHWEKVLPGKVHRVIYEDVIDDLEGEVRRLFAYLGVPFEPAALRFWETDRAVRTASSEQVRSPLFRQGLEQWRNFEPWLGPLKDALGPALTSWRG
ncbi:MAG TPA: sulfotransferase [Caulobacteraceae bacterium]|nr:sulfotransferase [Caulobacteraceae bacterium]